MEIKVPEVGESVFEAVVAKWHKKNGDRVTKDEPLCEIETDKITVELNAEADGILNVKAEEGTTVRIGAVIGVIEVTGAGEREGEARQKAKAAPLLEQPTHHVSPSERKAARSAGGQRTADSRQQAEAGAGGTAAKQELLFKEEVSSEEQPVHETGVVAPTAKEEERVTRQAMTPIRRRIAERLLAARQGTAMLTTFNEADMSQIAALRRKHGGSFQRRHGVKLGFMPFFVKACCEALKEFPGVNARIDGEDIVFNHFYDIGIAVSGEKGLVVPVLRDADHLGFAEIEKGIEDFVERIGSNRLTIGDLEGGTFTITNGGVFGSLLSTPILNPPQSGVLGMHAVQERPVVRDGQVVIRPMMYLALSYDHRIIDGREAVSFLVRIKECIENPERLMLEV